jgi:hypothetical protein
MMILSEIQPRKGLDAPVSSNAEAAAVTECSSSRRVKKATKNEQ